MGKAASDLLHPPFGGTVSQLLLRRAEEEPDKVILVRSEECLTLSHLAKAARGIAARLREVGVGPGDPVLTMMEPGPNYVAHFFAILLAGGLWIPVSPESKGPSLAHVLSQAKPKIAIVAPGTLSVLRSAGLQENSTVIEVDGWAMPEPGDLGQAVREAQGDPDDGRAVLFTSGTSGPPKGVIVSDRMLLASAAGCAVASGCESGDGYLMWEPMHHIGGPQLVIMALARGAKLVLVRRFSASSFWPDVRRNRVTKLHYLGGILEILLKAPVSKDDRMHPVKLAFGGGCRPEIGRVFQERFGIPIREVYGMTEASSFTTVNIGGPLGSVGQPMPWFDVDLASVDRSGKGEIVVRPRFPGLLTPGYLSDPAASGRLLRDGALHSGDLGRKDGDGNFYFVGRQSDSFRRRGENVSAWEVESALSLNADVAECAVVGVASDIGEHDILAFVILSEGVNFDPSALMDWCNKMMPRKHVPRYWKRVEHFERTPSQRIRKDLLDRSLDAAFDSAISA